MILIHTRAELAKARLAAEGRTAVVMTMGALHAGHAALFAAARAAADTVFATIFVNPLQFGPSEDLDRYPRTLNADLDRAEAAGVDAVFAPSAAEMYPAGRPVVTIDPGPLGAELEGAVRPGHFAGVLTVVAKLLQLVQPDAAYFGEKDYQQLVLIRQMVADLDFRSSIVGVPTIRESDGLALSSRNRYLNAEDRTRALTLSAALAAGAHQRDVGAVLVAARDVLAAAGVVPDYLEVRNPDLGPAPAVGPARLLAAVRVGTTRLIDNVALTLGVADPATASQIAPGHSTAAASSYER